MGSVERRKKRKMMRVGACGLVEHLSNVMAHAQKPDLVFQRNGQVHLNRRGVSVQSTAGSQGVRISGSNAEYTMFRGSVKGTDYHCIYISRCVSSVDCWQPRCAHQR